jgi:DNA-binding HxlR family transcriptional regulator
MDDQLRSDCPINFVLETLGDKWSLLVVRDLMLDGKDSYGDFLASEEGIATNILANRLTSLEEAGIIHRAPHPENKKKYTYSLTSKGADLLPMFVEIILWSAKYRPVTGARKDVVEAARKDKQRLIRSIRRSLRVVDTSRSVGRRPSPRPKRSRRI